MRKTSLLFSLYFLLIAFFCTIDQPVLAILAVSDQQVISVDFSNVKKTNNNKIVLKNEDRNIEYLISKKNSKEILQTISQCHGNIILSVDIDKNEIESASCQSKNKGNY